MTKSRALVMLAPGAEEMEAVIAVDVLRRAGVEVIIAGLEGRAPVRCSRQVTIVPDVALDVVAGSFDVLVLPGGAEGARRLAESALVGEWLRAQAGAERMIGAICAAPSALVSHGVHAGRAMTCHPSVRERVAAHGAYVDLPVVEDGPLITSQGPGTAFSFALTLVRRLLGDEAVAAVRAPMMFPEASMGVAEALQQQ